jgi:murein DD-endopeptidase MepM/ murein hydrolase activator NlpD
VRLCLAGGLAGALAGCAVADDRRAVPRAAPAPAARAAEAAPPAWRARRVVADAVAVAGGRLHTVKPGETGIAIARAYGVEWRRVAQANRLSPPYVLQIGDKLRLPSASEVATMSPEARARALKLDIDDVITGGDAAKSRRTTINRPPVAAAAAPTAAPALQSKVVRPMQANNAPQFEWPVSGRILSGFGAKPGGRFNDGVNLKASAGAPVRAAADGVVAYAGDGIPGFGNLLLIKHADGYVTAYAHNEAVLVDRGNRVKRGDVVARAGATGAVTEPQVHFEVRRDRQPVDPTSIIAGR